MPDAHIWIRKEDEAKWKSLGNNKSEFIHDALNGGHKLMTVLSKRYVKEVYEGKAPGMVGEGHLGQRVYPSFEGFEQWVSNLVVEGIYESKTT